MQIKCVAVDDEPMALELIKEYTSRFPALKMVQVFDDAIAAVEFLKVFPADLLFVDINMPDLTGIELVRSLAEKPMTIFTTAYKKFAIDGFELDALDYLLKPIDFDRFTKAVNKAISFYEYKTTRKDEMAQALFIRSEYRLIKVEINDIEYIESAEDYIKIHLVTGKFIMTLMTLKNILEKLPENKFRRIHRSYVVSLSKIKSVLNRKIYLTNVELPISDSYLDNLDNWLNR